MQFTAQTVLIYFDEEFSGKKKSKNVFHLKNKLKK